MPYLKLYLGEMDFVEHMRHFHQHMAMQSNNAFLRKAFPASVDHEALKWFQHLPSESVSSFNNLSCQLLRNYSDHIQERQGMYRIFEIAKGHEEFLKDYVDRLRLPW